MALPGPHRIKGQRAFDFLYQQGRRHHGAWMVLRTVEARPGLLKAGSASPASPWRCAVVISSKVSKRAVQRNRLRRLLHGHLLTCLATASPERAAWMLISLKPGSANADPEALLGECDQLLQQAGLRR